MRSMIEDIASAIVIAGFLTTALTLGAAFAG
jgi:hypothetical protein